MKKYIKEILKKTIPPIMIEFYLKHVDRFGFENQYNNWEAAAANSSGYDDDKIIKKTESSLLKIKRGVAVYERDSVLFDKVEYSWPVVASLLWIATQNGGEIDLLDFGGSLGSSYFQNLSFIKHLKKIRWNIVEQKAMVNIGREKFTTKNLRFYETISECIKENNPSVVLISSSLQYIQFPYKILQEIFKNKIKYVLIDRMPINKKEDIITVQKVNPEIYSASYPLWVLKEENVLNTFLMNNYKLIVDFDSLGNDFAIKKTGISGKYRGYLFKLKNNDE